jgi:hypothetical protein
MKTFSYDPKTGRYEFHFVDNISKHDIDVLKLTKNKGFSTKIDIEGLISQWGCRPNSFQHFYDITYHLSYLGLIKWKSKFKMHLTYNVKDYSKSKFVDVDGYFLTENGKAFLNGLFPEPKKKNVRR